MQLICPCLNVTVNVVVEDDENFLRDATVKLENIEEQLLCENDDEGALEDDFFSLCSGGNVARFVLDSEKGIVEKLPVLVKRRQIGRWEVHKCIVCNADACAVGSNCPGQVLVNTKLFLHDESVIAERRKSDEISPIFQVILPKMMKAELLAASNQQQQSAETAVTTTTNNTAEYNKSGYSIGATSAGVVSRSALHAVQACVGHYLRKEQELMEERIQKLTEQQQAAFDRLKADAKTEKLLVLALLAQRGGGGGSGTTSNYTSYESYWSSGSTSLGGLGLGEEEADSAVPLSPLSMNSAGGDPSPGPPQLPPPPSTALSDASRVIIGGNARMPPDGFYVPARPKAHSNPASLSGWKRKRHSGGPGLAPSLTSHPEEQQDIFSFEEQENDEFNQTSYLPADDEGDTTDDSGTGEDYNKYYPPPAPPPSLSVSGVAGGVPRRTSSLSEYARPAYYGASLPVRVPQRFADRRSLKLIDNDDSAADRRQQKQRVSSNNAVEATALDEDDVGEEDEEDEENVVDDRDHDHVRPKDVGASMQALTKSITSADDPERLFGERPQRRRYKTGEDRGSIPPPSLYQQQTSSPYYDPSYPFPTTVENRRKATVLVLFKEGENILQK